MPLTNASLTMNLAWAMNRVSAGGYSPLTQGNDSVTYNLGGLDIAVFNQLYAVQLSLATGISQTIDVTSLTNLVYETFSYGHITTIVVLPTGSKVTIQPGASNPLTWFFGGSTQSVTVPAGGVFLFSTDAGGDGDVAITTNKTLEFTNSGSTPLLCDVILLGSTT
jgi:hypothetical protein